MTMVEKYYAQVPLCDRDEEIFNVTTQAHASEESHKNINPRWKQFSAECRLRIESIAR